MEKKYTPGPWVPVNYAGFILLQDSGFYGEPDLLDQDKCEEAEQNAILAAAAPELLEALDDLIGYFCAFTPSEKEAKLKAEKAINKALGLPINLTDPITQSKIEQEAKDVTG